MGTIRIGIDIGGTFTDFALERDDERFTLKKLTTHQSPETCVLEGLDEILNTADASPDDVGLLIHGTTLATNALIERKGARTALVTTDGFRDILEIRAEDRYEQYDLAIEMPAPLVPRRLRFPIPERIDAHGGVRMDLSERALTDVAHRLEAEQVEAIAVGFLHSYAYPDHELRAGELLRRLLPAIPVSLSCEVSPEMREYERFSTTVANAYVQPLISGYLDRLEDGLQASGFRCPLFLMLSSGGITTVETAKRFPVRLVESGPAGGAAFSAHIARELDLERVLSFDMGGTTAKLCLVDAGAAKTSRSFEVARIGRFKKGSGLPLRIPVVDMVEIGAGGGSLCRVDDLGRIAVGPESAGSDPGPACYGRGGRGATVTDADVVLGRIDPDAFAGGTMRLDEPAAESSLRAFIGDALDLDARHAAIGVCEMIEETMASAARVHVIEEGADISGRVMIAFGGAAPLHAVTMADKLGIDRILIPCGAGVGSAIGFLRAPIAYEVIRSARVMLDAFQSQTVADLLETSEAEARAIVMAAIPANRVHVTRTVSMRYEGQGHELEVPLPEGDPTRHGYAQALKVAFENAYRAVYQRLVPEGTPECLSFSVRVEAPPALPGRTTETVLSHERRPRPIGTRPLVDTVTGVRRAVPVFMRHALRPGDLLEGPAIVSEAETTIIVSGRFQALVMADGTIDCRRRSIE